MMSRKPCIRLIGLVYFAVLLIAGVQLIVAADNRDSKAVKIAHGMMQAMGGENEWNNVHFVRFDFVVKQGTKTLGARSHLWDKMTGRYRLEEKTKVSKSEVVLFNTYSKQGAAYVEGKKLTGGEAKKALEDAYGAWINDMYWLAEPWKWLDPGVNLKYLDTKKEGSETFDEVELTFNHVGLTPGDKYHAFVSQKSHLMTHWDYILQGGEKGAWKWQYGDFKGIKLASNHTSSDGKMTINMGEVRILDAAEDAFFTDPSHALSGMK